MFYECSNLREIKEFSKIDNIKDVSFFLYKCINLKKLPKQFNFNTNNLTECKAMFYECKSLIKIPDINNWNIDKVNNLSFMFFGCEKLKEIPEPFSDENKIKNKDKSFMKYINKKEFFLEEEKIENKKEEKIENKKEEKINKEINDFRKYKSTKEIFFLTKETKIKEPFLNFKCILNNTNPIKYIY